MARVLVDVMLKPEILDPQGQAVQRALPRLGFDNVLSVRQGKRFELELDGDGDADPETLLGTVRAMAEKLLANKQMRELISAELDKYSTDWKSYERVKRFLLLPEEFTTGNDMLTPTLKVKRRNVLKRYGSDIDKLYA